MKLIIFSDAGEVVRELSAVERGRVADWLLDESVLWTDADFPGRDTRVRMYGSSFEVFIEENRLVMCTHGLGCSGRPAPVAHLTDVIQP
jgi:hypothetical protein